MTSVALGPTSRRSRRLLRIVGFQVSVIAAFLVVWEFGPRSDVVRRFVPFMDAFYLSSPTDVLVRLVEMVTGAWEPNVWPLLLMSGRAILLGGGSGLVLGVLVGLVLSHSATAHGIAMPYLVLLNATPKLALVPIIVVILGPTGSTTVAVTALVVFLVTLFGAVAGGQSAPVDQLLNAYLLGARGLDLMRIRLRYVLVWTFANLPNILATAFLAGIFAEVLSSGPGLGRLVRLALQRLDATGTMALVVFLSVIGVLLVRLGRVLARRQLHWFGDGRIL